MDSLILGLRVLVSLAAVFGLMWLVQRRLRAGNPGLRAKVLSVVARQSVGPKASVVLVDTDGQRFLLGVTEHGINVLHTTTTPDPEPLTSRESRTVGAHRTPSSVVPDPSRDADALRESSFQAELEKQQEQGTGAATRPTGSVLEPATWRLAADAIRSGRRS